MANIIGRDMAVDLGTANTLVYVRGKGILLDEPSVVALNSRTGEILAVGHEAKRMIGRTPETITPIRPMKDGVIADFEATERMLRHFIHQVHRRRYFAKPRMVICVPSGITAVEQRAVKEAGYQAGARKVYIIEEPMAAAIGAGLPVHQATGNMVVDVGGGTTEVAVISLGGIVTSLSIRTAGDDLDAAIVAWMKKEYSLLLGERTAEEVKMSLGSAFPMPEEPEAEIRGRDMVSGLPRTVVVSSAEVRQALDEPLHAIVDAVRSTLDQTPPELAGDIMDRGIVLTGGGALLRGLDERLRHETGMPVHVAEDPLTSVAFGAGKCVEEFDALQQVLVTEPGGSGSALMALLERPPAQRAAEPRPVVRERRWRRRPSPRFGSRYTPDPRGTRSLLIALLMACATLITLDHQAGGVALDPARRALGEVFGPAERATDAVVRPLTEIPGWFRGQRSLREQVAGLEAENARLRGELVTTDLDRNRLAEYDGLTAAAGAAGEALVPARVVGIGPAQSFSRTVTIDAGTRAGIAPDMTVVNGDGLVGRVLRVTSTTATVLLIVDGDSVVGGRIGSSLEAGFLRGRGVLGNDGRLDLELVDDTVVPAKDDVVVTWGSEDGAPYVAGIPVGRVTQVFTNLRETSQRAVIEPFVDFSSLDLVGVVVPSGTASDRALVEADGSLR